MRYLCSQCGSKSAGDTTHEGLFVRAGYGSRHDTATFIWLVRGDAVPKRGILCDACVDEHVSGGRLELISSSLGPSPGALSPAAQRELFAYGARRTYNTFWEKQDNRPYIPRPFEEGGMQDIIDLRDTMARQTDDPETVGACHAAAAIALGYADSDPGFERAATEWVDAQIAQNEEEETLLQALLAAQLSTGP